MVKSKIIYLCQTCGAQASKWSGQCNECMAWNTLVEEVVIPRKNQQDRRGYAAETSNKIMRLSDVHLEEKTRVKTGLSEFDRVLGGGLVSGSVVLVGGDPGIGKSTILLQTLCYLSQEYDGLYITGEESLQQVTLRARRLGLPEDKLKLFAETQVEKILTVASQEKPKIMVIDSIQTMYTDVLSSAPGAIGQVRESAAQLVRYAKQSDTAIFLVGHVTKEGSIAGPRVLEHMVDAVLYFEGEKDSRFRLIRSVKNRFGAVNELGLFAMTDRGLREVNNPSAIFLSRYEIPVSGSTIMATWEGTRPILIEIQALVDKTHIANPRRVTVGLDQNRLAMLLAVLHRHGGIATYEHDVFVNAVGGVRVMETAADLPILLSVISSLRNKPLPQELMAFGEIGLSGEIRPVQSGQERLKEAIKYGFKRAIIPYGNAPKMKIEGIDIYPVRSLNEVLQNL